MRVQNRKGYQLTILFYQSGGWGVGFGVEIVCNFT